MTPAPHEPWDERAEAELLLDAVLAEPGRRRAARARCNADARGAARLRAFEQRLERARRELCASADWSSAREERLVERVLAATTRAPRAPARTRSARRASLVPRLAAAGLLLCAAALALRGGRAPAPETRLQSASAGALVEQALLAARERLADSAGARRPAQASAAPAGRLELRLLEARAKGLRERRWETWLEALPLTELDPLAQALWCEVQLDRYVLTGELPRAWRRALAILERGTRQPAEQEEERSKLLARALARARTYGLCEGPMLASAAAREELWTSAWFDQMESAGREAGLADAGQWRAWVDWRGR